MRLVFLGITNYEHLLLLLERELGTPLQLFVNMVSFLGKTLP